MDTRGCFELEFELVMPHQWLILSMCVTLCCHNLEKEAITYLLSSFSLFWVHLSSCQALTTTRQPCYYFFFIILSFWVTIFITVGRFIDRENELRQSKPPVPQPPVRAPLDPWTRSRLTRQFAPPKEEKGSESDNWIIFSKCISRCIEGSVLVFVLVCKIHD